MTVVLNTNDEQKESIYDKIEDLKKFMSTIDKNDDAVDFKSLSEEEKIGILKDITETVTELNSIMKTLNDELNKK